ncbi:beta-propeller fold lactonase family protein [Gordonia sp. X0973]|uniref:lactonase family protein n=1 Tax=Gordonia sp. X0973 TaxID=2742602 RepID=UPI000F534BF9|nr:beta-propeller fold lactonase family protein [Gordonia sp. X0973]QKT05877.1 beta-propeller fold lactonase family protein [Gordonia sp. X0973]
MKLRVTLVTAALAAAALVGTVLPAHSPNAAADPPPAGNVVGTKPYNLYAHGFLSPQTVGYRATDHGPVRPIAGTPATGIGTWPKTATPDGRFLLVGAGAPLALQSYAIDRAGRLHLRQSVPLSDIPVGLEFTPDSKVFYLTQGAVNSRIQAYRLGSDGRFSKIGPAKSLGKFTDGLSTLAIAPNAKSLYVGTYHLGQLLRYDILPNGSLGPLRQRISTGGAGPIFPVITPNGRHIYIPNETANTVASFNILGNGTLVHTGQAPMPTGLFPHVPAITPDGRHLYVPNLMSTYISAFAINANGTLRALANAPSADGPIGPMPESVSLSPSGKALWSLGQNMANGGFCVLQRFWVMPNGTLKRDRSVEINTGTMNSDGKIITMAPGY